MHAFRSSAALPYRTADEYPDNITQGGSFEMDMFRRSLLKGVSASGALVNSCGLNKKNFLNALLNAS